MENSKIKIIDLWYLDGNYNKPVKTKGFKALVQKDKYYSPQDGYIYIDPKTNAYLASYSRDVVFETEESANQTLRDQLKDHKTYLEKSVKEDSEELQRINDLKL